MPCRPKIQYIAAHGFSVAICSLYHRQGKLQSGAHGAPAPCLKLSVRWGGRGVGWGQEECDPVDSAFKKPINRLLFPQQVRGLEIAQANWGWEWLTGL